MLSWMSGSSEVVVVVAAVVVLVVLVLVVVADADPLGRHTAALPLRS